MECVLCYSTVILGLELNVDVWYETDWWSVGSDVNMIFKTLLTIIYHFAISYWFYIFHKNNNLNCGHPFCGYVSQLKWFSNKGIPNNITWIKMLISNGILNTISYIILYTNLQYRTVDLILIYRYIWLAHQLLILNLLFNSVDVDK